MDVREKLVEIIQNSVGGCARHWAEVIADGLIAHGVTVQEDCKACAEATQNCIVKLQEQIAELRTVQEWISVKDRLPDKNVRVLVWMQDNEEGYTQMDTDRWSCTMEQGYHWIRWGKSVTHWMPLPDAPKGE